MGLLIVRFNTNISSLSCRFGSFEIFKPTDKVTGRQGPSVGRIDILHQMLDYTIKTFFKEVYTVVLQDHYKPIKMDS